MGEFVDKDSFLVKTHGAVDGIYVLQDNNILKIPGNGTQVVVSEFDVCDKSIGQILLREDRLIFNDRTIGT